MKRLYCERLGEAELTEGESTNLVLASRNDLATARKEAAKGKSIVVV